MYTKSAQPVLYSLVGGASHSISERGALLQTILKNRMIFFDLFHLCPYSATEAGPQTRYSAVLLFKGLYMILSRLRFKKSIGQQVI